MVINRKNLLLLFLLFLLYSNANTQEVKKLKEFEIKELPNEKELTIYPDQSASYIYIYSLLDGLTFSDNNGQIIDKKYEKEKNRYLLVIKCERAIFKVSRSDFIEGKIEIKNKPEPRTTYYYKVEEKETEYNLEKGEFLLHSFPEGAQIMVEGNPVFNELKEVTPYTFKGGWEAKKYKIILSLLDYDKKDTVITIKSGKNEPLTVKLVPSIGYLNFNIGQINTKIKINDTLISFTAGKIEKVKKGNVKINISANNYINKDTVIIVEAGKTIDVNCTLKPKMGTYSLILQNSAKQLLEADFLYIDGNKASVRQFNKYPIQEGTHKLKIIKEGYAIVEKNITIDENKDTPDNIELFNMIEINITSNPHETNVYIDSKYIGITPVKTNIEIKDHNIKIEKLDYETYENTFTVNNNQYDYSFSLNKKGLTHLKKDAHILLTLSLVSLAAFSSLGYYSYSTYFSLKKNVSDYVNTTDNGTATKLHNDIVNKRIIVPCTVLGTLCSAYALYKFSKHYFNVKKDLRSFYSQIYITPVDKGIAFSFKLDF